MNMIDPSKPRVLVVEDEPGVSLYVCRFFEHPDYDWQAVPATSVAAAIALLDTRLELIVLDLMLPDDSGVKVLEALRRTGWPIPVIVSSGINALSAEEAVRGLMMDRDIMMTKPVYMPDMMAFAGRIKADWAAVNLRGY